MNKDHWEAIRQRLASVLTEMTRQWHLSAYFPKNEMPFDEWMEQLREFVEVDEYELAYEGIILTLQDRPFVLSGKTAVGLLEVALLLGYKTDRDEDKMFDRRAVNK